jgi:hypothetical protein
MTTAAAFKEWILSEEPFKLAGADPKFAAQPLVPHHLGALIGHLNTLTGSNDARRHFLKYLFDVETSRALHVRHVNSLYYWLNVKQDADEKYYIGNPRAAQTAAAVVAAAREAAGQLELKL